MEKKDLAYMFRAYDIRGIYNQELTPETVVEIGMAAANHLDMIYPNQDLQMAVGGDIRHSSIPLTQALMSGLLSAGVDVTYVGIVPFGVCLFSGWKLKKNAIGFVTASHLPSEWNGVKFYYGDGVGFSESDNMAIRNIFLKSDYHRSNWNEIGTLDSVSLRNDYIEHLRKQIHLERPIKVVVDCGNAAAGLIAPNLMEAIGFDVFPLFAEIDHSFPNRPAEPEAKNVTVLCDTIKKEKADFGVAFDGDADRALIVDDKGNPLSPEESAIIIGNQMLQNKRGTILGNVECSLALEKVLGDRANISRIPVGHTFLTLEARERGDVILGVESSGHMVFPEYFLFDDAMLIPLKMGEVLSQLSDPLSNLRNIIPRFERKRLGFDCSDATKFKVIENLTKQLEQKYEVNTIDGIRVAFDDGWILMRASNTSPMIRLTIEANSPQRLQELEIKFSRYLKDGIKKAK
ncbi:MAG: hypothetical protein ACFFDT_11855 [Candidatus Hodarchaeota archaeon]